MSVQLFISPYCRCSPEMRRRIRDRVLAARPEASWHEINVLHDLERAVECGVRSTPSIVVNGRVVTSGKLDLGALQKALVEADHERQHR